MNKKWEYYENKNENLIETITNNYNISELLAKVLLNRGIISEEDLSLYLKPTRNDFHNPFLMPDMEKAVNRINDAINKNEKIIIYGDYDVDGVTSITVLKQFLEERGIKVGYYIPNRLEEGYGLNKEAVDKIINDKYSLVITVDCGISGIEEVEKFNANGIDVIITDHHEQLDILPNAYAVVDAKRKDNKYPFRELAGVGVVFKLIQAISTKLNLESKEYLKYLDKVCIGTISDIVPLIDENRVIAKLGLKLVEKTKNVGLKELITESGYKTINSTTISFGIAPRINACGRMGHQIDALQLFLTKDLDEAKEITKKLSEYNSLRQEIEKKIYDDAIEQIEKIDLNKVHTLVLAGNNWHHGVIGIVASKLTEKFYKPTILICFDGGIGKGSGRSIQGFDLHSALAQTSNYLEQYGGHEMAVGLSIKQENFENFKQAFEEVAKNKNTKQLIQIIKIDAEINKKDLTISTVEDLKQLEPFGEKNRNPIFIYKNLKINSIRSLSEGKHLKLSLKDDNILINAIGFNLGYMAEDYLIGDKVNIVGNLEKNNFNEQETVQINLKDMMKSI